MSIFTNFFRSNPVRAVDDSEAYRQELLRREIEATKGIFGPVKPGTIRDFFCVDQHTWIWYEEWTDEAGHRKRMTTRFDVRGGNVAKSQNGGEYKLLSAEELQNFKASVAAYIQTVKKSVYSELR